MKFEDLRMIIVCVSGYNSLHLLQAFLEYMEYRTLLPAWKHHLVGGHQ